MIGDFIDMSLKRVDVVNRSHEPPTKSEERLATNISRQPPLDVVQQLLFVALELAARLVERAPRFVSPALERLDLTLEPKLLGQTSAAEFSKRAKNKNAFVMRLMEAPKLWVIGSENDLPVVA